MILLPVWEIAPSSSRRRRSLCGFAVALAVAFGAVTVLPALNYVLCVVLTVLIALGAVYLLLVSTTDGGGAGSSGAGRRALIEEAADADEGEAAAKAAVPGPPRKKRLYFLDNVKSVLTVVVVLHHTAGQSFGAGGGWLSLFGYRSPFLIFNTALSLLDQSYFMCLFFFISGYFTPRSYDKKGPKAFLRDKLKRLGPWRTCRSHTHASVPTGTAVGFRRAPLWTHARSHDRTIPCFHTTSDRFRIPL